MENGNQKESFQIITRIETLEKGKWKKIKLNATEFLQEVLSVC